eukprot:CAMPEP_0180651954 /NCGR_PEP_ID=MMETSP1037_2-20121125/53206_1 /TAXON_ID=632150 /ORGANISM="Azadinium spinosum, Strain 3D9" /LENGTH=126 /DNA_ID=CAMNT_0022677729 /DNA_START=91 /DNA_END=468 /DNA_ORIENTATION=-
MELVQEQVSPSPAQSNHCSPPASLPNTSATIAAFVRMSQDRSIDIVCTSSTVATLLIQLVKLCLGASTVSMAVSFLSNDMVASVASGHAGNCPISGPALLPRRKCTTSVSCQANNVTPMTNNVPSA